MAQFDNLPETSRLAINHMITATEKDKKLLKKALDRVAEDVAANTTAIAALPTFDSGTYNPTLIGSTSGSYTFGGGQTTLAYYRIGDLAHVQGFLQITGETSPSGFLRLSLPYQGASLAESSDNSYIPCVIYSHGGTIENPHIRVLGNTYATFYKITDAGSPTQLDEADVDSAFFMSLNFMYRITEP